MSRETLSPAEAAKHLGMNISTIRRWINTGKLKTTKAQRDGIELKKNICLLLPLHRIIANISCSQ